ncbi:MAG TPA: flavodoxin domain-containing protein [Hanamia sp.]|nr:flavodoxin domain-containing protein [Hanamia sp.]
MLVEQKLNSLLELINTSSNDELIWINGYLNGILSKQIIPEIKPVAKNAVAKITIVYGTETGNSKRLATDFAGKAKKHGVHAKVQSLDQYRLNDLSKEEYFLAVISTHGDGEPPAAAKKFYDHVHQNGFKLSQLKYSVLALGDSAYPLFCKAGEDVDEQLNKLGANRIAPLQKCDVEYDVEAEEWFTKVINALNQTSEQQSPSITPVIKKTSGKKIYSGKVREHINLNDIGSNKETFHIEIEAEDVQYQPGDSIGIIPENKKEIVEKIIEITAVDPGRNIDYKDQLISVYDLLKKKLNILNLPERVVKKYAAVIQQEIPATKIDLLDLLKIYSLKDSNQFIEVLKILEPIAPRLYSISSSPEAHPGEVHITVAKNCFTINNELKHGLASEFLSLLNEENELPFYISPNNNFRLPEEDKDVIMIGPGTGIAPFRSFLWERDSTGASGKNWLFFGEQHFISDFLYQTEIQNFVETNLLTKIDTAFSRDQQEKIYVQHKIQKHGAEFFEWLEAGSYVYLCGAKEPMSKDVEQTILQIIETFGERSKEEATQYLENLKETERYRTDVY